MDRPGETRREPRKDKRTARGSEATVKGASEGGERKKARVAQRETVAREKKEMGGEGDQLGEAWGREEGRGRGIPWPGRDGWMG
ncbi:hypothetical protein BJX76DRAFT_188948 [Aspergillus varians]